MSKTKKIISLLIAVALIMTMATVAIVSTSAAVKVYFEDSLNWGNIHAYCYGGDGEILGQWVGTACTDEGDGIWSIEVNGTPSHIIFHANDDANQTCDIPFAGEGMIAKLTGEWIPGGFGKDVAVAEFVAYDNGDDDNTTTTVAGGEDIVTTTAEAGDVVTTTVAGNDPVTGDTITVYFTNNWAFLSQNVYYWGTDADPEWPGVAMTFVEQNENGEDIYTAEVPANATGIIFNGEHDQQPGVIRQTVDITEFADNAGFYCVEEVEGKITVGTYEMPDNDDTVTTTAAADLTTTTAADITTTVSGDVDPTTTVGGDVDPTTTVGGDVDPTTTVGGDVDPTTTATGLEPAPEETGIVVAGTTYEVPAGTTVTYVVDLTAARLFENIQAVVSYDSTKLELVRIKSDDPDVADWEVEGPERCPNLDGVIFNAGAEGLVKFNASKVAGYNFKNEAKTLVTLEFVVNDTAKNEIALTIEEMTIKGDGTESYFTGGQAVITEGITVAEYLDYVVPTTTTTEEITTVTTTADGGEGTTVTEPGTTVTEPGTTATAGEPATDPTGVEGTTADAGVKPPVTGASAYIYIAIAIMAMVACAVVVLRKKAND